MTILELFKQYPDQCEKILFTGRTAQKNYDAREARKALRRELLSNRANLEMLCL